MSTYTGHLDTFARDRLPPRSQWPSLRFELPELQYGPRLNAAAVLVDQALAEGAEARPALIGEMTTWSYRQLKSHVDRIAHVLRSDLQLIPGNRVLLRGPNTPMLYAIWLAVLKSGGIAVTTMPLLRANELAKILAKARVDMALCDHRFAQELDTAAVMTGYAKLRLTFGNGELEALMKNRPDAFAACETSSEDVAILAFTSGTTGHPKATIHFHRDLMAMADVVGRHLLETSIDDVYAGSPPLGFTFGLGALLVIPLRFRAASLCIESPTPENLLNGIQKHRVTGLFTAPVAYRSLLPLLPSFDIDSLKRCISAGDALPQVTSDAWKAATGMRIIDGIGSTEMTHIFISAKAAQARPGATGKALPGYEACVMGEDGRALPLGSTGLLAVRGPTGCRYLEDPRQQEYVQHGWNITGDTYYLDPDGYFWFRSRADDMIVSSGYNIAGPEVEAALLQHPAVHECAVIGKPDADRGTIVKAFIVLQAGYCASPELAQALQDFTKQTIAPYKYPRAVEFVATLPKSQTGKVQRFVLRSLESKSS